MSGRWLKTLICGYLGVLSLGVPAALGQAKEIHFFDARMGTLTGVQFLITGSAGSVDRLYRNDDTVPARVDATASVSAVVSFPDGFALPDLVETQPLADSLTLDPGQEGQVGVAFDYHTTLNVTQQYLDRFIGDPSQTFLIAHGIVASDLNVSVDPGNANVTLLNEVIGPGLPSEVIVAYQYVENPVPEPGGVALVAGLGGLMVMVLNRPRSTRVL